MKKTVYLRTGRNNIGMDESPNSMVAQGDLPARIRKTDDDSRCSSVECDVHPDGDINEGVSEQDCMYEQDTGVIYVI